MDLRDFAEKLYVSGAAQEAEFAKEILENLDFAETAEHLELCEDIQAYAPKHMKEWAPRKLIEWLGGRSDLLGEIEEKFSDHPQTLTYAGVAWKAGKDAADVTESLLDVIDHAALALEAEGLEGELLNMLQSLKDTCDEKVWDL